MEKQFKLDIHVHTSETSSCGHVSAQEAVRLYEQAGYDGIIITDHYHREYFNSLGNLTWNDKIDCYLKGYRTAKSEAAKGKMKVFLGIEYRNVESDNDYLVFGMDESMLFKEPELYSRSIQDAFACFRQYGAIILQAHPFRKRFEKDKGDFVRYSSMDYPELLDGFEFYNGNKNWIQDPAETKAAAEKYPNLILVSGSDFHHPSHLATGGIILNGNFDTIQEIAEAVRNNEIRELIHSDEN